MRKNVMLLPVVSVFFLMLSSCRSSDTDQKLINSGPTAVNINLLGSTYEDDSAPSGAQASLGKSVANGLALVNEKQTILVNPGMVIVSELSNSNDKSNLSTQASLSSNSQAAIPGGALGSTVRFRVIAYKSSDGSYQGHQDYQVGATASPIMLDGGVSYDMIVYSYGSSDILPVINGSEQSNLSAAVVNYNDVNRNFMYQRISNYIPSGGGNNNVLNITLMHKIAEVTTVLTSNAGNITGVSNALLSPHNANGTINLSNGIQTRSGSTTTGVSFSSFGSTTVTSAPVFVNANNVSAGVFSAAVTMVGGPLKNINLSNSFGVTPGTKKTLTINMKRCGAIVDGVFKEFMCHNMGATTSADPFTPSAAIHGAKYQWGKALTNTTGRTQAQDQASAAAVSGWSTVNASNGAWSDAVKTGTDPCPTGYRVPTGAQWRSVINSNTLARVGTWTNSATNYSSGVKFGDYLFLPAAGYRNIANGSLYYRGSYGYYWSSPESSITYANYLFFGTLSTYVSNNLNRTFGLSVRCVAE
ncbi:hypothetical protein CMT57_06410 [Elizabethkingia anophelis]|uniref:fibrobacter succinogenes major paralogous domain-containing protein n=1 Tax=Elizabethkingia anophelis TaxID=1117645 RepID=UPI002012FC7B|nr:fibrobacter succinogenes major paralogous domain-containing protein [Elizabethkingia anophelis]MCL1689404.1 fibrobacter succinogenes major paralogous domain-containing protein [Elizabethkingia anophelis]MDV4009466.1 hypothetical protein [Elizabethkingia anophelis]